MVAKTLILSGGGTLGQVHLGVVDYLEEKNMLQHIDCFAANSVGAVLALFLSVGYKTSELVALFTKFNLQDVLDGSFDLNRIGMAWGIEDGLLLDAFIINTVAEKGFPARITFDELFVKTGKELLIVTTNVNTMRPHYFGTRYTPDIAVVDAVRASISIPVLITPKYIDGIPYWDGFLCDNFPIIAARKLRPNDMMIGSLIESFKADTPTHFLEACMNLLGKKMVSDICLHCLDLDNQIIIKIPMTSFTGLDYHMSEKDKKFCQQQGYDHAKERLASCPQLVANDSDP